MMSARGKGSSGVSDGSSAMSKSLASFSALAMTRWEGVQEHRPSMIREGSRVSLFCTVVDEGVGTFFFLIGALVVCNFMLSECRKEARMKCYMCHRV